MADRRQPKPTYREKKLARLRAMRILIGDGSDTELGPFLVGDAAMIADMLDPNVTVDGRTRMDALTRVAAVGSLFAQATLRTLRRHAIDIACVERGISRPRTSWLACGILTVGADEETHFHCLFCEKNLATLGSGSGAAPRVFAEPLERHADVCAMAYLLASGAT